MLNTPLHDTYNAPVVCLLVDDDDDDREIFQFALKEVKLPVKLQVAINGKHALEKLADCEQLPDLIFLDLNMPFLGGKQVLAEIKKDERLKSIPVFIYSTSAQQADKIETTALGAADFIVKPNHVRELIEILSQVFTTLQKT